MNVFARIILKWKENLKSSQLRDYIVRRYLATPSGVLLMYPASSLYPSFDPTRREWYREALSRPGQIVLSAPYLDSGMSVSHVAHSKVEKIRFPMTYGTPKGTELRGSKIERLFFSGGSGPIVTLSHTVFAANQNSVVAVVAADITLGFFHRSEILLEISPSSLHFANENSDR